MSSLNLINAEAFNVLFKSQFKLSSYEFDAGAAQTVLQNTFPPVIICDPGGGAIDMLLPAEADSDGLVFLIFNAANAAEVITVKEDGDVTTIATVAQNEGVLVYCNGTIWHALVGGIT
jgi:hypothetical protein